MQPTYNTPRIDERCIDIIFTHQFILSHLERAHSQTAKTATNKYGFKKFKWRQKQFNKKIKITENAKLDKKWLQKFDQNTITKIHKNLDNKNNEK